MAGCSCLLLRESRLLSSLQQCHCGGRISAVRNPRPLPSLCPGLGGAHTQTHTQASIWDVDGTGMQQVPNADLDLALRKVSPLTFQPLAVLTLVSHGWTVPPCQGLSHCVCVAVDAVTAVNDRPDSQAQSAFYHVADYYVCMCPHDVIVRLDVFHLRSFHCQ